MNLVLNGETYHTRDALTVADLLKELGLDARPCAVEINKELAPKARHAETILREDDAVEVVTLVGGG